MKKIENGESYKYVWGWNKKREWTQDFNWAKDANVLSLHQSHPSERIFAIPPGELAELSTDHSLTTTTLPGDISLS